MIKYTEFNFKELEGIEAVSDGKGHYIINYPFSFDIETTTTNIHGELLSYMYIWQCGIGNCAVYGRTWNEFKEFLALLSNALQLTPRRLAYIYIHNAGYEFEFMQGHFEIEKLFARATHHPFYFSLKGYNFIFRDSLILSGLSLEKTAENLTKHNIKKLIGDLNYTIQRNSKTPLSKIELEYCENDVLILTAFISEEMEYNGNICKIPLTRTGYARRRFKNALKNWSGWKEWKRRIIANYPNEQTFCMLYKCFAGGFVHANCDFVRIPIENVISIDINSSYPAQMVRHKYPLGKWLHIKKLETLSIKRFEKLVENKACMVELMIENLRPKSSHHIISRSKCVGVYGGIYDNGRIVSAELCRTFATDIDYKIIKMFYTWDRIKILDMYICNYEYLPTPFVNEILNLFALKTELKGITEKLDEYMRGKGDLNSGYGMTVTNPLNDEIIFQDGEWKIERGEISELLKENRNSGGYFLPYSVGVWVTAWGRFELLNMVNLIGKDVVYNDTDSIKMINYNQHKSIIDNYNQKCIADLETALHHHKIPLSKLSPKTTKGIVKILGLFEVDEKYKVFKTLGCKRYCYIDEDNNFSFTASGIPKKHGAANSKTPYQYIIKKAVENKKNPIDIFSDGLELPAEWSGKLTHYYISKKWKNKVVDYLGNVDEVSEGGGVVLVSQPYKMSLGADFRLFLSGLLNQGYDAPEQLPFYSKRSELKTNPFK